MLSSSHVLAMDTKNLLDVCDSIRTRFPDVKYELSDVPSTSNQPEEKTIQHKIQTHIEQNVTEQIYSNQAPLSDVGIYDNQAAIQEQLQIIEEPSSPSQLSGTDSQFNNQKILSN